VLCLASLFTSYSNSQTLTPGTESYTENLTNFTSGASPTTSTWQNAGTIGAPLSCWSPGDSGYCGPLPMVSAWGEGSNIINFSYQLTDLYQVVNIGAALANAGTGVKVTGFNFGFTAKNGNGWDNGQQDYLSAYVKFYSNSPGQGQGQNNLTESYVYDLNYQFGWTQFNYNETFKNSYDLSKLSTAQYGFVGGDSNGWAGPYGPEVSNTSFSLKYSVDPCASNVFYSPSCPGYLEALAKLQPEPIPTEPVITSTSSGVNVSVSDVQVSPLGTTATAQPSSTSVRSSNSSPATLQLALSIARSEQKRISTIEQTVVTEAVRQAEQASESASASAESISEQAITGSTNASSQTMTSRSSTASSFVGQDTVVLGAAGPSGAVSTATESVSAISEFDTNAMMQNLQSIAARAVDTNVEVAANDTIKFSGHSVLSDAIEPKLMLLDSGQGTQSNTVNRNVVPNEAANGVDIAQMAVQPLGYQAYSVAMPDTQFYAPREIYRNQRTVDNARALRQLTNDGRHRDMVEQQYRR
jgi:hypothetical protein